MTADLMGAARSLQLPAVLDPVYTPVARELLRLYFGTGGGQERWTGAWFETLGTPWDDAGVVDRFTSDDVVAVATLSVDVPMGVAIDLLACGGAHGWLAEAHRLLAEIPPDLHLVDAPDDVLAAGSPLSRLWTLLRAQHGMGPTTTSKLLARKRPLLVPVYDSVVAARTGLGGSADQWHLLRDALRADDRRLIHHLTALHASAGLSRWVGPLRVLDVVVWMDGKDPGRSVRLAEEYGLLSSEPAVLANAGGS